MERGARRGGSSTEDPSWDETRFGGTIDLFPELGKYHYDGHRKCGVCMKPAESLAHENRCPACGKPLVLGVLHRVEALADRPPGQRPPQACPGEYIVPLADLLSALLGRGSQSKTVTRAYRDLLERFGPELHILRHVPPEALTDVPIPDLAEAIQRIRSGRVRRIPGFDGQYGQIRIFDDVFSIAE